MFACSDGTQHEMICDIREQGLDGLVVASCSPKLHQVTFREVSKRADLNPFAYTQVNIREQDSWAHGDDPEGATAKAIGLVRAGIAKTRHSVGARAAGGRDHGRHDGRRRRDRRPARRDRPGRRRAARLPRRARARCSVAGWPPSARCSPTTQDGRAQIDQLVAEVARAAGDHGASPTRSWSASPAASATTRPRSGSTRPGTEPFTRRRRVHRDRHRVRHLRTRGGRVRLRRPRRAHAAGVQDAGRRHRPAH